MDNHFPGGAWPVMLTPFTPDNRVDYGALEKLIDWYIANGVSGLFAVCQSSEMFFLSLEERVGIARFVREKVGGRVPVIASGHISDDIEGQARELNRIAETDVDSVILITNRLAREDESDDVWFANLDKLLKLIPDSVKLGFYECPYPYKRVLDKKATRHIAETGRFYFLKDTSRDIHNMAEKIEASKGTNLKLYNACTATLLESLRLGATGYSGVMCNTQCRLYSYLTAHYMDADAEKLSDILTMSAWMEYQCYPVNAKYYLQGEGVPIGLDSRMKDKSLFIETFAGEMEVLRRITKEAEKLYIK